MDWNPNRITYFARTNFRTEAEVFGIRQADRLYHTYVIGKTGAGKSTLIETLIRSDILAGKGFAMVDPLAVGGGLRAQHRCNARECRFKKRLRNPLTYQTHSRSVTLADYLAAPARTPPVTFVALFPNHTENFTDRSDITNAEEIAIVCDGSFETMGMFTPRPGVAVLDTKLADEEITEWAIQILEHCHCRCVPHKRFVRKHDT